MCSLVFKGEEFFLIYILPFVFTIVGAYFSLEIAKSCLVIGSARHNCFEIDARLYLELYTTVNVSSVTMAAFSRCGEILNCDTSPCNNGIVPELGKEYYCLSYREDLKMLTTSRGPYIRSFGAFLVFITGCIGSTGSILVLIGSFPKLVENCRLGTAKYSTLTKSGEEFGKINQTTRFCLIDDK